MMTNVPGLAVRVEPLEDIWLGRAVGCGLEVEATGATGGVDTGLEGVALPLPLSTTLWTPSNLTSTVGRLYGAGRALPVVCLLLPLIGTLALLGCLAMLNE